MASWILLVVILFYIVAFSVVAFALFWVVRLGVRFGLRDHQSWVEASRPKT
jgi:hypothetical protein